MSNERVSFFSHPAIGVWAYPSYTVRWKQEASTKAATIRKMKLIILFIFLFSSILVLSRTFVSVVFAAVSIWLVTILLLVTVLLLVTTIWITILLWITAVLLLAVLALWSAVASFLLVSAFLVLAIIVTVILVLFLLFLRLVESAEV